MDNRYSGRAGTRRYPGSAFALIGEVILEAMRATKLNQLSLGQWIVLIAMACLASISVAQHQEIKRLHTFADIQAETLANQQEWATRAVTRLELIRKYNIPFRYLEVLADASEEHNLDLEFMVGLMQVESSFNPNAASNKNAYGLMQVRFSTALSLDPTLESFWQLYDPERNIRIGAAYFRQLLDRYDGNYRMAALAYNMGPTRLDGELMGNLDISDRYYRKIRAAGTVDE